MRRTLFVVALLAALIPTAGASAQVVPMGQFSGYSTGTAVHVHAVDNGTNRLEDTEVAFSGANVNSSGLGAALTNEMQQAYQMAAKMGDMSAGRGSGLEVGLGTDVPNITDANQINPGSTVQAFAPVSTDLLTKEVGPIDLDPLANARLLRGQAQATYSTNNKVCVLGKPISFGLGYAANAHLVNSSPTNSLLASETGPDDAAHQSKSFTYLIPNDDGTYGLVTETHQILAPVTLFSGTPNALTIVFAGEWVLRSTATGKPGGAKVEYAPAGHPTSTTPVVTITRAGANAVFLTTQDLLGQDGLAIDLGPLGEIVLGEGPRAINGATGSSPEMAADGTMAAGAVDVARVILNLSDNLTVADLRVGHMESRAMVPVGGIECRIPVSKSGTPASVVAGSEQVITYTITIPADVEAFKAVACDLMKIKVVDVTTAEEGVKFNIVSASNDGMISGNTVTWENLGTYKPGDAPIVLTVGLKVPSDSGAGKITDTATATAVLGNCKGNASADSSTLAGLAKMESAALGGSAIFRGPDATRPDVMGEVLAAPGPTPVGGVQTGFGGTSRSNLLLPLGALALLGLMTSRRLRRIG